MSKRRVLQALAALFVLLCRFLWRMRTIGPISRAVPPSGQIREQTAQMMRWNAMTGQTLLGERLGCRFESGHHPQAS
jgi:hypothetical protein